MEKGYVFGLDIGTRNIVGVVGTMHHNRFKVLAMASKEHETRAMLDGQIHDIYKVADTIRAVKNELEKQLQTELTECSIAAAGRVLKTVNASADYEFEDETRIEQEHIYSLNLLAVEKAHVALNEKSEHKFYCVGNTPVRYTLNGYDISNLEGHKGTKIGVDLIATFLPEEVVDGLYAAVEFAGLSVASLTLEPIAAMNIAIPEKYRLLNIALIDVGAGTSDICVTKDGSVVAYGMIPFAGDELTEAVAKACLIDFNAAEKIKVNLGNKKNGFTTYKDIMGIQQKIEYDELRAIIDPIIDEGAKSVAAKIKELNGRKPVNAVFVVGGGGKIDGYTDKVAEYLGLPKERVAVRGEEVLTTVDFEVTRFVKDSLYVTPIGICTNHYNQKNNFVFVMTNGQRVKLYDNNRLTVVDAIMQIGYPNEKLFPRRGNELNFTINGKNRMIRGGSGDGAVIKLNGNVTNLNASIVQNDIIEVVESGIGSDAKCTIGELEEFNSSISFIVNDKKVSCPRFAYVNGEMKSEFYEIKNGDVVLMENYYTLKQLFEFLDLEMVGLDIYVNNEKANDKTLVYENFNVKFKDAEYVSENLAMKDVDSDAENEELRKEIKRPPKGKELVRETFDNLTIRGSVEAQNAIAGEETEVVKEIRNITVIINGVPYILAGKPEYLVLDIFTVYDFDTTKPQGDLVFKHNGVDAEYTAALNEGDQIVLTWKK